MTVYQRHILKRLAHGEVIRVEYINNPPSSAKRIYTLGELRLREKLVNKLLEERLIRPNSDGLFGEAGPAQSFRLWRASEGGA